ncbi:hypothetical protein GQR36_08080 [Enterococcus termitis]
MRKLRLAIVLAAVACVLLLFFNLNKNNAQEMNKENETVEFSEQIISSSLEKSPELSPEEKNSWMRLLQKDMNWLNNRNVIRKFI